MNVARLPHEIEPLFLNKQSNHRSIQVNALRSSEQGVPESLVGLQELAGAFTQRITAVHQYTKHAWDCETKILRSNKDFLHSLGHVKLDLTSVSIFHFTPRSIIHFTRLDHLNTKNTPWPQMVDDAANDDDDNEIPQTRSSAKPPPLRDVSSVLDRYIDKRKWRNNGNGTTVKFNGDTFARHAVEHAEKYKFKENESAMNYLGIPRRSALATQSTTIELVAQFKDCVYFVNPYDGRIYCVANKTAIKGFRERGFVETAVTHITGIPSSYPRRAMPQEAVSATTNPVEIAAPHQLVFPESREFPPLWKICVDATTAENIVHAFEVKVYNEITKSVYSPYKQWTKENCTTFGIKKKSCFTKYLQAYFTCRHIYKDKEPKDVKLPLAKLAQAAATYWNKAKADGSFRKKPDWNQTACDLANGDYNHEE